MSTAKAFQRLLSGRTTSSWSFIAPHDCGFLGPCVCGIEVLQIDDVRRSVPMMLEAYVLQKCILILHRGDAFPFFSFLFNCVPVGSS